MIVRQGKLIDSKLTATNVKQFYVELTGIVRRYIERTTNVRAPEQTTDEFLRGTADHPSFPADERTKLQHFLEAADLVKFAGHQPATEDIDASLQRARTFVGSVASPFQAMDSAV